MKKILSFILMLILSLGVFGGGYGLLKPKIIEEKTFAEEVIEYEDDEVFINNDNIKAEDNTEENNLQDIELCIIGSASKTFTPDRAKITAVIETLDLDMKKSKDDNFEIFDKVTNILKDEGIEESAIVLDSFTSYPSYDYNAGKTLIGYYSITTFTFEVDDLKDLKMYVDKIIENGTTSIRDINYELSNINEAYQEVLLMAIANSKAKAFKIVGNEDISIKSIKEEYIYSCCTLYRNYDEVFEDNSLIGSIKVEARVNVEFA